MHTPPAYEQLQYQGKSGESAGVTGNCRQVTDECPQTESGAGRDRLADELQGFLRTEVGIAGGNMVGIAGQYQQ